MYQRLLYTSAIAISLTGLYVLYSVAMQSIVVVPVRTEQPVVRDQYSEAQRPAENVRVAMSHIPLPHREWAAKSAYMLRAEQAFVYTEHWQQVADNNKRIRFDQFAMVWVSLDKEGNEQAVSMVSDHALLEFASALDPGSPQPGRVVRAVLEGEVKITGPDGLSVIGHDFIFDEAELSLHTWNPVHFRLQSHQGSASRMKMKLIPAEGTPGNDRPHVYGVESIHLIANPRHENQFVRFKIQMPQEGQQKPVEVKCSRELEYNVGASTAILTTDVIVWTRTGEKIDRLDCDRLTLQFVPKKPNGASPETSSKPDHEQKKPEFQHVERDLEFRWLMAESQFEATGRHGPGVKIDSKTQGVTAWMGRLTYNAETRTVTMTSAEKDPFVTVMQNRSELRVPTIEAHLGESPDGQMSLSSLFCKGAGKLKYVDEKTGKTMLVATWKQHLSKTTDPENGLDLVELVEDAQFRQPDQFSGLIAESIKIWLAPLNISAVPNASTQPAEPQQPEPKRLLAQRNVALQSPQLEIKRTNELDILFDEPENPLNTSSRPARPHLHAVSLTTNQARPVVFASIPATAENGAWPPVEIPSGAAAAPASRKTTKTKVNPIAVSADRIGVRLRQIPGRQEPQLLALRSEGKVDISMERTPGEKPTTLEGDRVEVESQGLNEEIIHVFGAPAKIRDPKFKIFGKAIHLDRQANRAWVDGNGQLQLALPDDARIPRAEGVAASRELNVRWNEQMTFDGLDAKFIGRVEAKLGLASMECELMSLQLMDRLAFQSISADSKPAVRTIECQENVKFKNATYSEKKLIDRYRGAVGEFKWNHATGEINAQGPGEIQVWRRQKTAGSSFAPQDTIQANRPIPVELTEWDYTGIQFEGTLKGRIGGELNGISDEQSARIEDRVKVTHGPVSRPTDEVDPDNLPSKAGTIHCDRLEFVNHPVSKKNAVEYRQLFGVGNAEIEGQVDGRRFTASADEISFDGEKGLYILKGYAKQNATLTEIGASTNSGRRIEFNPATKYLKVERATGGQWSASR